MNRAIQQAGRDIRVEIQGDLREIAEPVQRDASSLAQARILGAGDDWSLMRIGQRVDMVYVAPVKRGTKIPARKRPNFAPLMLRKAMRPALNRHKAQTERRFERIIGKITKAFNAGRLGG